MSIWRSLSVVPRSALSGKPKYSNASAGLGTAAPHIDAGEQKQPHDVDEVPIPSREFKPEMLRRLELSCHGAQQADDEKDRADDHMGAVESGRHEKRGAIDVARIVE